MAKKLEDRPIRVDKDEAQRLCQTILQSLSEARGATGSITTSLSKWRGYYEEQAADDKPRWKGASMLRVPFVKTSQLAMKADIVPAIIGVDPIVHYEGEGKAAARAADKLERLQHELLTRYCHASNVLNEMIDTSLRDGTCLLMAMWETRTARRWGWVQNELTGELEEKDAQVVTYDYPLITVVPIDRVTLLPTQSANIYDAPGLAVQFVVSPDDLQQRADLGLYSQTAVNKILDLTASDTTIEQTPVQQALLGITTTAPGSTDEHDRSQNSLTITELWWRYRKSKSEKGEDWHITLHEQTQEVLRAVPWQVWRDNTPTPRPCCLPRPYTQSSGLYGESLASVGAGYTQDTKTTLMRQCVDMAERNLQRRILVGVSAYRQMTEKFGENAADKFKQPGALIPVPESVLASRSMTTIEEGGHPGAIISLLQYADLEGQKTGASDAMKGIKQGGDTTATQATQMFESSKRIMGLVVGNLAEAVSDLGNIIHDLLIQHQGRESIQQLWDALQQDDEDPMDLYEALSFPFQITANGVSEAASRSMRTAQAQQLFALLSTIPYISQDPRRLYRLVNYVAAETSPVNYPRDIIGTEEEWATFQQQQQQQQMDMMAHQQVGAESAAMMAAQPPPPPMPPTEGAPQ